MQLLNFSLCFADEQKRAAGIEEIKDNGLRRQMKEALTFHTRAPVGAAVDNRACILLDVFHQVFPQRTLDVGIYIEAPPWLLPKLVYYANREAVPVFVEFEPYYNWPGFALPRGSIRFQMVEVKL